MTNDKQEKQDDFDNSLDMSPVIQAMNERLAHFEKNLLANTTATQEIANNTIGLVHLYQDLEAGTKVLCRVALGIKFMGELIKDTYIPVCIIVVIFSTALNRDLPHWVHMIFKFFGGA